MGLLPRRVESERAPEEARVLDIEGSDADRAFEALSSETARRVLSVIYDQPSTPTEVHEEVGTSLQNIHHHLGRLEEADLIEPAGVGYSEKGNEMTIYAPKSEAVVLFAGRESDRSRLSRLLGRVLGLYIFLAAVVAAVGSARVLLSGSGGDAALSTTSQSGGGSGDAASFSAEAAGRTADVAASGGLDPLLVFFLGGLVAIAGLAAYWYVVGR